MSRRITSGQLADSPDTEDKLRSSILRMMLRLSKKSGLCPKCLVIKNVKKLGEHPVGGGGFGDVWKGKIDGQVVCLKVVKVYLVSDVQNLMTVCSISLAMTEISNPLAQEYMREAIVWQQLKHPNLLPFVGMYYLDKAREQLCLVSPWMERGNLVHYLKSTSTELVDHESLAYDIATGLSHLHGMKIVHGDLKGVNILMTPDGRATIADFGLSRVADTHTLRLDTSTSTQAKGTTRWLSPELLRPDPPCSSSTSSDIYAYACVCYEIFARSIPFHELAEGAVIVAILLDKQQPSRPEVSELTDAMWEIMASCWAYDPALRPTAMDVLARIGRITSMRTDTRLESYPALDWDPAQLANVRKNVKYPAVDTMEFLRVLGRDQLPPFPLPDGATRNEHLAHEERNGSEEGFWKRVFGQRKRFSAHTTPVHVHPNDEPAHTVFGKPLKEILPYASVQISTANANGEMYVWGYVPVVVAKCGLYLKENGTVTPSMALTKLDLNDSLLSQRRKSKVFSM
ncbi:hypothetical protein V5O48_008671 [Marasmius crinis-equi]|uniref:Protein kinase domain-containing protein n=1 Tax=Marasmius crinis-equi TaxID=585013 RepID=A0ABR3FDL3_9AGAR